MCDFPPPGTPKEVLFNAVWASLTDEIEQKELDEEIMEVFEMLGAHVLARLVHEYFIKI